MDPDSKKHVTQDNVRSEDIKPEGRTDGPKNFGPEFVTGPGGKLVPTRPNEQIERTARAAAAGARAEGKDEREVVRSFAGAMPEEAVAPLSASAEPVPDVVLASMPIHEREAHMKDTDKKYTDDALKRAQYDIGVGLARQNRALPLEASEYLEEGYNDTRDGMKKQLQLRRERESGERGPDQTEQSRQQGGSSGGTRTPTAKAGPALSDEDKADYDAGALYAARGEALPEGAPEAARAGYKDQLEAQAGTQ